MKLGIVLQARMGSSRLPGKVLLAIGKHTLLEHIFCRVARSLSGAELVVATTELPEDDAIVEASRRHGVPMFRGEKLNVLDRYFQCALVNGFQHIVRLTADNPFVDIEEMDHLIHLHLKEQADFSYSFNSLPIGCGAEVFSFNALEKSHREGHDAHHIEHVDEFILDNIAQFSVRSLDVPVSKNKPQVRLTVDTPDDYARACFIVDHANMDHITTEEAIALAMAFDTQRSSKESGR